MRIFMLPMLVAISLADIVSSANAEMTIRPTTDDPVVARSNIASPTNTSNLKTGLGNDWQMRQAVTSQKLSYQMPVESMITGNIDYRGSVSSLPNFVESALQNDNGLKVLAQESEAAGHRKKAAYFNLLPKIDFTVTGQHKSHSADALGSSSEEYTTTASINANWDIFTSGGHLAAISAARADASATQSRYLAGERQKALESAELYLRYAAAHRLVNIMHTSLGRIKRIRKSTRAQYNAGFASRTDLAQVDAEVAQLQKQVATAKQTVDHLKVEWESRTKQTAPASIKLPGAGHLLKSGREETIRQVMLVNPTLEAAEAEALSADARARVTRSAYLPRISAFASFTRELEGNSFSENGDNWSAGVRVTVPLADFNASSNYQNDRALALASRYRSADTRVLLERELRKTWVTKESLKENASILKRNLSARKRALTGVKKQVEASLLPVSDLLREELRLANAKIEILQNQMALNSNIYRIAIHLPGMTLKKLAGL